MKWREGNVFTGVCLSTRGGVCLGSVCLGMSAGGCLLGCVSSQGTPAQVGGCLGVVSAYILPDTVSGRAVRILLECKLISTNVHEVMTLGKANLQHKTLNTTPDYDWLV